MKILPLSEALSASSYPGRGIVVGADERGRAVIIYFIMGRSANSRNRVFVPCGEGIRTEAFDPAAMADPSLVIYAPVRVAGGHTIVTNGDQTDTICQHLLGGASFEAALATRSFEPDAPNYTPRISGIVAINGPAFSYKLSILKSAMGDDAACWRQYFEYAQPLKGVGHFIHTYRRDGEPLPAFEGEPKAVRLHGGMDEIAGEAWDALDEANKISLFVRVIDPQNGASTTRIINKNQQSRRDQANV
jgi:IMP cyclohydrolase